MLNPTSKTTNPMGSCARCHASKDIARYNKTMGTMIAMMNPGNWMYPNAYVAMMTPTMDPKLYTKRYNAIMKKYGGSDGYATVTKK